MIKTILAAGAMALALAVPVKAKQKDYQMGTLAKVPLHAKNLVKVGFTDNTDCTPGLAGTNCTGGITNNYDGQLFAAMPDGSEVLIGNCGSGARLTDRLFPCSQKYVLMLTEQDGTNVYLTHTWMHHDIGGKFADNSRVLYRIEHHGGVTYILIPDPANPKKEGMYNRLKLPKQPSDRANAPVATDNITAMCASGKLTPDQQKEFCGK